MAAINSKVQNCGLTQVILFNEDVECAIVWMGDGGRKGVFLAVNPRNKGFRCNGNRDFLINEGGLGIVAGCQGDAKFTDAEGE